MSPPNVRPPPEAVSAKKREIARRYGRRNRGRFGRTAFNAIRRREIERFAQIVTNAEDFTRCLIAWSWHLPPSANPLQAVLNVASVLRRPISPADASSILEEASIIRKSKSADGIAKLLGLTYDQRRTLRITTIGSVNVKKGDRREIRRVCDKFKKEQKRRAKGVRARDEYEANSVAEQARAQGVSRMTIYRRKRAEQAKNVSHVTGVSAAFFLMVRTHL